MSSAIITIATLMVTGVPWGHVTVRNLTDVDRPPTVAISGVPVPRGAVRQPTDVLVLSDKNTRVPAQMDALGRWGDGSIKWLLLSVPTPRLGAQQALTYRIVPRAVGPSAANSKHGEGPKLRITEAGTRVTVDTGVTVWALDLATPDAFTSLGRSGQPALARSAPLAVFGDSAWSGASVRRWGWERKGELQSVLWSEVLLSMPAVGQGQLVLRRRYVFRAGADAVDVRQSLIWEGMLCSPDARKCGGQVNGVRIRRATEAMTMMAGSGEPWLLVDGRLEKAAKGASLRQLAQPQAAPRYEAKADTVTWSGARAARSAMALRAPGGVLTVAVQHLEHREPAALVATPQGQLAVHWIDDDIWMAAKQGTWVNLVWSVTPPVDDLSDVPVLQQTWAAAQHPLRPWSEPAVWSLVEEIPGGHVAEVPYDDMLRSTLQRTDQLLRSGRTEGVMTHGLFPRMPSELRSCDEAPSAASALHWCGTWTDYHNASRSAVLWAMRSGDTAALDAWATPAALRMLTTQIIRCAPGDAYFYCGQAPAGYGAFRADFNSSHAYWDNLLLQYWLTGDAEILEQVQRGADNMRRYICPSTPGRSCSANESPHDAWVPLSGRVASQWREAFRFLWTATGDAQWQTEWRSSLARQLTQRYGETVDGHGFLTDAAWNNSGGTSTQLWMGSLYDARDLQRWVEDMDDAPLGEPAIAPSRVLAAWARSLTDYGATVSGRGTIDSTWPNQLAFSWSGPRLGGTVSNVRAHAGGSDPVLYTTGKAALTSALAWGAMHGAGANVLSLARAATQYAFPAAGAYPLGKEQGLYQSRLHAAVAALFTASVTVDMPPAVIAPELEPEPEPEPPVVVEPEPKPPVPPTTDPNRPRYFGPLHVEDYWQPEDGNDFAPAFERLFVSPNCRPPEGSRDRNWRGCPIELAARDYPVSRTVRPCRAVHVRGAGANGWGALTQLVAACDITALRVPFFDECDAEKSGFGGQWSTFEGIAVISKGRCNAKDASKVRVGVDIQGRAVVRDVYAAGFTIGIRVQASVDVKPWRSNANGTILENVTAMNNEHHGAWFIGGDANVVHVEAVDFSSNCTQAQDHNETLRSCVNLRDDSFLGISVITAHTATALDAKGTRYPGFYFNGVNAPTPCVGCYGESDQASHYVGPLATVVGGLFNQSHGSGWRIAGRYTTPFEVRGTHGRLFLGGGDAFLTFEPPGKAANYPFRIRAAGDYLRLDVANLDAAVLGLIGLTPNVGMGTLRVLGKVTGP